MLCAVADIGKTSMRLTVVQEGGAVLHSEKKQAPPPLRGSYDALDVEATEAWLLAALAKAGRLYPITDVIIVTHGAAAARIGADDQLDAPVMDYEWDVAAATPGYDRERPPFAETGSPLLPIGLNLGRQLAHLDTGFGTSGSYLLLPQYCAFRLCGERASERSSLGCHTDLWNPEAGTWSSLAARRGWDRRLPAIRDAGEVLGTLTGEAAKATGLPRSVRVRCGAHDSNAALVPFLEGDGRAVLSTGTWFVTMVPGANGRNLDEMRDTLIGVDVRGRPVPTSRFMGGREHLMAAGEHALQPSSEALKAALAKKLLIEPNLTDSGGPFPGRRGHVPTPFDTPEERSAAATLYVALMAETCLSLLPSTGSLAVEGPAATPIFCGVLAALRPGLKVERVIGGGAAHGAAALVLDDMPPPETVPAEPVGDVAALLAYAEAWRERVAG